MKTQLITPSSSQLVSVPLEDIKDHLRIPIGETNEDNLLEGLRDAAQGYVENYTNRKLLTQKWSVYFDDWPNKDSFEIPYPPLQYLGSSSRASTALSYTNSTQKSVTWSSSNFAADSVSEPGRLVRDYEITTWPTTATLHNNNPISITFICGYTTTSNIPQSIKQAMLLIIGDLYENRENSIVGQTITTIPLAAQSLLASYRVFSF
jgi:uncharacterized phiE125 gp8 family phage protein